MNKPITATEIKQNRERFLEEPETIAVTKAFGRLQDAVFGPLIKRMKQILRKEKENAT